MFGVHEMKAEKPLRDIDEPEVEEILKAVHWEAGEARMGARKVETAREDEVFVFSDGSKSTEIWRAIIQIDALPFDIAFGPKTTKADATKEAINFALNLGGQPLVRVKAASA